MTRPISFFCLLCINSVLNSQSFVKKDSSEIVPFKHRIYYQINLDSNKIDQNRLFFNHRVSFYGNDQNFSGLTGTIGSTLVPILYENNFYTNIKLGRVANDPYFYGPQTIPYFALNKPLSELDFTFFGNGNEEFKGFLSQNLSRYINLGIGIRRTNNKGYFLNQENTHNNIYSYLVLDKGRLRTNFEFVLNDFNLKESGGYLPDIYQSRVNPGLWVAAAPTLLIAKNQIKNYQLSFRYRYLILGQTPSRDSLLFIPKRSSLFIDHQLQRFSDRQFYSDTVNARTRGEYGILASPLISTMNSVYLHSGMQSDFRINFENQGLKITGYNVFSDNRLEVGTQFGQYVRSYDFLNLGLGLNAEYQWKKNLNIIGRSYKSFLGYTENDFYLQGEVSAFLKGINLRTWINYSQQKPSFLSSMHYTTGIDQFYDLKTQKTLETGFGFQIESLKLSGKLQYFRIDDFMNFDTLMQPSQIENNFFQIYVKQDWDYKWLYFPTEILYQNSLFHRGMIRQMLAFKNRLFSDKNNVLVGAELSLNFNYAMGRYSSFFMQPIWTQTIPVADIYPKLDLFATFKISKVHLSLVFDNFLSTYLKTGISYVQNHPMTPSAFYLRMNWRFLE